MVPDIEHLNAMLLASRSITLERALHTALWFNAVSDEKGQLTEPHPTTLKWTSIDSKSAYHHHLQQPHTREQLIKYNWLDVSIDYHINSWGFRSTREYDLVTEPCVIALGCSFTFGTGLHEHQIWASLLAERLGVALVNLGTPGHSLDLNSIWLHLMGHGIVNPIAVVVYEPPPNRISWLHQYQDKGDSSTVVFADNLAGMIKTTAIKASSSISNDYDREMLNLSSGMLNNLLLNSAFHSVKNYYLINSWCQQRNIPLIWNHDRPNSELPYFYPVGKNYSLARDLAHYGPDWHIHLADVFYDKFERA